MIRHASVLSAVETALVIIRCRVQLLPEVSTVFGSCLKSTVRLLRLEWLALYGGAGRALRRRGDAVREE
jgi:hypothetical protein